MMLAASSGPHGNDTLLARLKHRIKADGPLTIADYMDACLSDPDFGYYTTRDPFGVSGDFTTAPEISQIFGELIGLWAAVVWQQMGSPDDIALVELGPGRGTLMADALRAARTVPEFRNACSVHLVETSPVLRRAQAERLADSGTEPNWHRALRDLPAGPAILIANEFLDALPVRQFVLRQGKWFERCVGLSEQDALEFQTGPEVSGSRTGVSEDVRACAIEGSIVECRPYARRFVEQLAERAPEFPLTALIIDYGHEASAPGETLQAVRAHDFTDVLERPGQADLTAHVDFGDLRETAEHDGLHAHGPLTQRDFLLGLGLKERCEKLIANADATTREYIASGTRRLVDPDQMGQLFKVIALSSSQQPPPPFPGQ